MALVHYKNRKSDTPASQHPVFSNLNEGPRTPDITTPTGITGVGIGTLGAGLGALAVTLASPILLDFGAGLAAVGAVIKIGDVVAQRKRKK